MYIHQRIVSRSLLSHKPFTRSLIFHCRCHQNSLKLTLKLKRKKNCVQKNQFFKVRYLSTGLWLLVRLGWWFHSLKKRQKTDLSRKIIAPNSVEIKIPREHWAFHIKKITCMCNYSNYINFGRKLKTKTPVIIYLRYCDE